MVEDKADSQIGRRGLPGLAAAGLGLLALIAAVPAPTVALLLSVGAAVAGTTELLEVNRPGAKWARAGIAAGTVAAAIVLGRSALESLNLSGLAKLYLNFDTVSGLGPALLRGMMNTVRLAAVAEVAGIAAGLVLALLAISKRRSVRWPAIAYIDLFRGTPLLVQLSFIYFGLPFIGIRLDALAAGTTGLALNSAAYVAEIFRAGIQSIDRGQMEAARGVGMPYRTAMRYVIVPQAFRRVIPPLTNEFIALLKDSSLVAALGTTIGGRELFKVARDAYASTANATPFVAASLLYLVLTLPLVRLVNRLERNLRSGAAR